MKTRCTNTGVWIVSLERGDAIRESVEGLAKRQGIGAAKIEAVGAVEDAELGFYRLAEKRYVRKTFGGILELVSLQGNLTLKDGEPFLHAHVAISGEDFFVHGGHLFDAKAGVVIEMFITPFAPPLPRIMCDEIGLARWEPEADH